MKGTKEHLKDIKETLHVLRELRIKEKRWTDDEKEREEESCAYKNMEILLPFFLANFMYPTDFSRIDLPIDVLKNDILNIISSIKRDGFYPSPYLYIREKTDFVDFAADSIKFFIIARKYIRNIKETFPEKEKVLKDSEEIIKKAIHILKNFAKRDKLGARWAPSKETVVKGRSYCNVYFTSQAVSALIFLLENHKKTFEIEEYEDIEQLVKEASLWILSQEKDGLIVGDETKTQLETNFTFYGLNSLLDCYTFHEQEIQSKIFQIFKSLINYLKSKSEVTFANYHDVPVKGLKKPMYYDDRSSIGNLITVLCKGRDIFKEDLVVEDIFYLINYYVGELFKSRDISSNLWDSGNLLLYLNSRAIEALLYSTKYGTPIEYKISEREALSALQKTLSNPIVQRIFLNELTSLEFIKKFNSVKD